MWQRVLRRFRPPRIEDPVFGSLAYRYEAWEGSVTPPFAGVAVGLVVEAEERGPSDAQRAFYRELAERYPALATEIEDALLEQLQNWDASIGREEVWERFALESLSVPRLDGAEASWELCYALVGDPHVFCVMLDGWAVLGIRVDG